jgi:hypothetical protein
MIEQPSFISSEITFPQRVSMTIIPSLKMAKSVVPPPYQLKQLLLLFFFLTKTASAEAKGSNVKPDNSIPEL